MSVSVATIAKKVLEAMASNKKGRHFLLWVIGIAITILLLPVLLLWGMFGWMGTDEIVKTEDTTQIIEENQAQIDSVDSACANIVKACIDKGLDVKTQKKAQAIYVFMLQGYESNENFYTDYADCFRSTDAGKDEYDLISEKFSVTISDEDRELIEEIYLNE